jgi:hypothetical protein
MSTTRTHFCNCCKDRICEGNPGVGFYFRSGNTEFEHTHLLWKAENHLCEKCIDAIWEMSNKLRLEERKQMELDAIHG